MPDTLSRLSYEDTNHCVQLLVLICLLDQNRWYDIDSVSVAVGQPKEDVSRHLDVLVSQNWINRSVELDQDTGITVSRFAVTEQGYAQAEHFIENRTCVRAPV